ncbi:MAG: ATP cone domain-containing protein [Candidatus Saccharimonadales bacterium]
MSKAIDIVKRKSRQPESFRREKLHASVHAACLSVRSHDGAADQTANQVCDAVLIWLEERPKVTSQDIRRVAGKQLRKYHPEAAYMYEQQRNII